MTPSDLPEQGDPVPYQPGQRVPGGLEYDLPGPTGSADKRREETVAAIRRASAVYGYLKRRVLQIALAERDERLR